MQRPATAFRETADDTLEHVPRKSIGVGKDVMQINVAGPRSATLYSRVRPTVKPGQQMTLADACTTEQGGADTCPRVEGLTSKAGKAIEGRSMDLRNIDVEHRWLGDAISDERVGVLDRSEKVLKRGATFWLLDAGLLIETCDIDVTSAMHRPVMSPPHVCPHLARQV